MSWIYPRIITLSGVVLLGSVSSNFRKLFNLKPQLNFLIQSKKPLFGSNTFLFGSHHSSTDYISTESISESGSNSPNGNTVFEHLINLEESQNDLEFLALGSITSSNFDFEAINGTPETISKTLEMMKVVDLKSFLRQLGGKYNKGDRKAAIVEQCYQYLTSPTSQGSNLLRSFSSDSFQDKTDPLGLKASVLLCFKYIIVV